ncbi:MAG TPA: MFS transporter [Tepidisphaeraceae bacterium]|jgi:nucleoside transporter
MTTLNYQPALAPPALRPGLQIRLSLMMFLQFAIQGAWLPLLFGFLYNYVGIDQKTVGNILAVGAVGAMLSPLIAGQIADRYMNAERVMALCHLVGAAVVLRIAYSPNPSELYLLSFTYGLLYTPTLALVNAISFRHLPDAGRDFGKVRVWGTAGWICAGIAIGHWLLFKAGNDRALQFKYMADAMKLSAILGVALALYSFTLPATPPAPGREKFAPSEALKEILRQPLLTLFCLTFIVASLHAFFFARAAEYLTAGRLDVAPDSWINKVFGVGGAGLMTVGQISEVIVLSLMPLIIPRVPRKVLFAIGLTAYALRFFAFAYLPHAWAIIPALALHGIVFGCFFFLVFITIDEHTTRDVRSSAQNVFNLIIFGFGVILGNWFSGMLGAWTTGPGSTVNWQTFYAVPGWITLACLVVFLLMYPNRPAARPGAALETVGN